MNRVVIVLVSVDYINAKEICQQNNGLDFKSTQAIIESFVKELVKEEDFIGDVTTNNIMAVSLDEFISMCNDQSVSMENYFICKVTKRIGESGLEIFDEWREETEFDAKILGDLADFNSIVIELSDEVAYQIGYDEEGDSFCFNNVSDNDKNGSIDYSDDFEMLYVWEKQLKQIIADFKNN